MPKIYDATGALREPSELKVLRFSSEREAYVALAVLNSNLFYWFVRIFSDCRNLNLREIKYFPIDIKKLAISAEGAELHLAANKLMKDIRLKSEVRSLGNLEIQNTFPAKSKPLIDDIDGILAQYVGFTEEELEWVVMFDAKYRAARG